VTRRARGLFVTGTDTGVGKTAVTCGLLRAALRCGVRAVGMKPVAAGARQSNGRPRNGDVEALVRAGAVQVERRALNPYLLRPAIAPHLAAREAGIALDIATMVRAYRALAAHADAVIVEGAGGFLVPIDERLDLSELPRRLQLPVVLVVGMRLGCLSHALLTAEAVRARGLELVGWVANRIDPAMRRYGDNVATLRARLCAPLLAEIPFARGARARAAAIDRAIDTEQLSQWLCEPRATANQS
jgi:dethiobiotin synthetase